MKKTLYFLLGFFFFVSFWIGVDKAFSEPHTIVISASKIYYNAKTGTKIGIETTDGKFLVIAGNENVVYVQNGRVVPLVDWYSLPAPPGAPLDQLLEPSIIVMK